MLYADEMLQLQVDQRRHDDLFHRDIATLPLDRQLKHMALHFAKYAGRMATSRGNNSKTYVDMMIICLSTANMLNVILWDTMPSEDSPIHHDQTDTYFKNVVEHAGLIAAACEKIDHLEDISYRREIVKSVGILTWIVLFQADNLWHPLEGQIRARWNYIEANFGGPRAVA